MTDPVYDQGLAKKTANAKAQAPLNSATLYGALAKAQAMMPPAIFNKVNPHFRSRYADFSALRAATIPALSANGLSIIQTTGFDANNNFMLFTRLAHESGEWIEGAWPLLFAPDKPQAMGSSYSYGRRYGWGGIVGEASEEDDDANAAEGAIKNGGQKSERITAAQLSELTYLADEVSADKIKLCKYLNVGSLAELPTSRFKDAMAALESKRT